MLAKRKRYFVYSAVIQFDTRNTSSDTAPFNGPGSGGCSDWFPSHAEVLGSTPSVCPCYSQGGASKPRVIKNVTRWIRSETRVWIGNKQVFCRPDQCSLTNSYVDNNSSLIS
jgi:hypothetical protein